MPQTYQKLEDGQFIMTFADLEGDLPFLQRSLALYKEEYKEIFPSSVMQDDDFSIALDEDDKPYIKFPDNVICVNIGDLTDKTRSNTGRKECYNLKLVDIISNTHNRYGNRMVSILGNRETTKFRLQNELNNKYINHVLEQELSLSADQRKLTADKRDPNFVWVDGPAKSFLTSLKIDILLKNGTIKNESELKVENKINLDDQRLIDISDQAVREYFVAQTVETQQIIYAKWMLANSCGAGDLWNDIATEAETQNDSQTLDVLKNYFSRADGPYVNYLNHCQIGAQIGTTLFTHGGLEDNSFNMPKTLLKVLTPQQIKEIFGENASAENLPQVNGRLETNSALQMLSALNTWYTTLMAYRFGANAEKDDVKEEAIAELLNMGLPRGRHDGASLINIAFTDKDGAYGNPITAKTHAKLINNGDAQPICLAYQGHMPAERPRIGTVFNQVDGQDVLLHRLDGDTCNYRKEKAAVALSIRADNGHTVVNLAYVDQSPEARLRRQLLTSRSETGRLEMPNGDALNKDVDFLGRPVKFSEADKGWNVVDYNEADGSYILFKQNGFPKFNPETKVVTADELYNSFRLQDHLKNQALAAKELDARFEIIEKEAAAKNGPLKQFLKETLVARLSKLKDGEKIAVTLVDIQNDFVLKGFALYALGGENTVLSNIALLDAISELIVQDPSVAQKIDIVTSQDAHILNRDIASPDSVTMANSSYGKQETVAAIIAEQKELEPFVHGQGTFGLHCLNGTVGAAIAKPIETRLAALSALVQIHRFGKINFSGPKAGMLLKAEVDLSDAKYQDQANGIYDPKKLSYLEFFQDANYQDVLVTGICGDVCVQQAAEGLVKHVKHVSVIDPLVHYLVVPGVHQFDKVRGNTVASYDEKGIEYIESGEFRANPELNSEVLFASKRNASSISNISMMVLGGFIAAAGIAAVAIAFTVLNVATFGIVGLVVAGIGVAAALSGVGLFATGAYKNRNTTPYIPLEEADDAPAPVMCNIF